MSMRNHQHFEDAFNAAMASLSNLRETLSEPYFMMALWRIDSVTGKIHMDRHTWRYPHADMQESIKMLERMDDREPDLEPLPLAEPLGRCFDVDIP